MFTEGIHIVDVTYATVVRNVRKELKSFQHLRKRRNIIVSDFDIFRTVMDDERLIAEVREHPCLYNTKIADYKVLLKKANAWKAIAAALGPSVSGKTI